jgi:uncharacterized membrane protein YeaQ/YmgE (transglycosylase-associated protein family)
MGLLWFLAFGLIVGLIARAVTPGSQSMGWVMTILLGVAGSFVGALLASFVSPHSWSEFNTVGLVGSVLGSIVLLLLGGLASRRGTFA